MSSITVPYVQSQVVCVVLLGNYLFLAAPFVTVQYELFLAMLFVTAKYELFLVLSFVTFQYEVFGHILRCTFTVQEHFQVVLLVTLPRDVIW